MTRQRERALLKALRAEAARVADSYPDPIIEHVNLPSAAQPVLLAAGEVEWHTDEYHPRYTGLLILRNDNRLKLLRYSRRLVVEPLRVGSFVAFDSHRLHAAFKRPIADFSHTAEPGGLLIALVAESSKRLPTRAQVIRDFLAPQENTK